MPESIILSKYIPMVNNHFFRLLYFSFIIAIWSQSSFGQTSNPEPWTENQLLHPSELAGITNKEKDLPIIFSIGPGAIIKGSIDIGPAKDNEYLDKLSTELSKLPKDKEIIIYCGCCPFEHCPNIRPAFKLLNSMEFTKHKLLNLPQNIKKDWIDKGYPMYK